MSLHENGHNPSLRRIPDAQKTKQYMLHDRPYNNVPLYIRKNNCSPLRVPTYNNRPFLGLTLVKILAIDGVKTPYERYGCFYIPRPEGRGYYIVANLQLST